MNSAPSVTDWFQLEDYACVSSFGLAEWYVALDIRLAYDMGGEPTQHDDRHEFWREYLSRTRPTNVKKLLASDAFQWDFEPLPRAAPRVVNNPRKQFAPQVGTQTGHQVIPHWAHGSTPPPPLGRDVKKSKLNAKKAATADEEPISGCFAKDLTSGPPPAADVCVTSARLPELIQLAAIEQSP